MKLRTTLLLLATGLFGLVGSALAEPQTFDTRPAYSGSVFTFNGGTFGQTFTGVYSVQSMTYNFFAGAGGSSAATNLSATFGQWNGSSFVGGTTVSFGTINIPASNSGWAPLPNNTSPGGPYNTYAYTFDLTTLVSPMISATYGYNTSPGNTYALMLTDLTGGTNLGLGVTNIDAFAYGATNIGFNDWTFSQISVFTTPVPEASTVASLAALVLVAGLVALRLRQRRALQPAPIAA
ncbi:MAG: hypothetical protein HZA32_19625 [Opitutae bacterium]|nr:hypothetical protein [Opitutae bacterium]